MALTRSGGGIYAQRSVASAQSSYVCLPSCLLFAKSQPLAGSLHVGSSARPWASSSSLELAGALAGPSIEYTSPRIFSSAKSNTSCRARMAPSSCRTPRGNGTSTQASLVWTGEPRAMHVCSARTQPLAGIAVPPCGIQRQRIVQEPSPWRGIVVPPPCCARRDSSGPFVATRVMPRKQKFRIINQSL